MAVLATVVMVLSCLVIPGGITGQAASKKMTVSCKKTLAVNCTTTIKTNVKATFKSSNKKIATVNSKGVVKGKKAGTAKITVTSKSNKKQKKIITIKVKNQLVVTAPQNAKATLEAGETVKIKTNLSAKFKSSNTKVATVSSKGVVTAKQAGTAKITVTAKKNKKLKKTVTITVREASTEQPATETPATETPATETPATEQPTTEQPATETPTTEQPTTEQPTTETPAPEQPTEEAKVVGITAKYRGDKVPNDLELINWFGIEVEAVYSDGTKKEIICNYENGLDYEYVSTETENRKTYAKYKVTYKEFSTEFKVELIDVGDTLYPIRLYALYKGDTIEKGSVPSISDFSNTVVFSDWKTKEDADPSKIRLILYYDYGDEYEYKVAYDYTFTDENGNELYVCTWLVAGVPYE